MQKKDKLTSSIIIPFYNGREFIFETIDSLQKQTRQVDEIIIIDDGSTDMVSIDILNKVKKQNNNIQIIHQENKGISGAMTTGAKKAICDIIFQIDCDDVLHEQYIQKYMNVFESDEDVAAVTCDYASFFDGKDYENDKNIHSIYKPDGIVLPKLFFQNCAGGANSAFRKVILEKIDFWDERYCSFQDWGLWFKFVEYNLKLQIIPEILYYYRVHTDSDIHTKAINFDLEQNIILSIQKIIQKNPEMFAYEIYPKLHKLGIDGHKNKRLKKEIKNMKNSHFWKMRNVYMKIIKG